MNTQGRRPDGETVFTVAAAALVGMCLAAWAGVQLASLIHTGQWAETPFQESPRLLWQLIVHPGDLNVASILTIYIGAGGVLAVIGGLAAVVWRLWDQNRDDKDRGAKWAKPRDLKPLLVSKPQPGRLTLGTVDKKLVATEQQHSVAVIGPAGTGKTTGFAIPALLEWDGPVIATSVKGDLVEHTIAQRQTAGEVWVYDPTGSTGQAAAGWNPLAGSNDWQGALRMAAWLVSTGRAGERGGLQDSDFWYAVAQKLLAPLLFAAATSGRTMRDVVRWVDLQDAEEPAIALYASGLMDAIQAFEATISREEKALSSAYTTTETVIAAFSDPSVLATTTATPSITPTRLLDGGSHTLFVCGPLHEQARLRPLFTAVIEEIVHAVYSRANRPETRLTKPLLLVIDEAANIAPLPDLAQIASTARGVGIQLVTVWQDFAQLQARYGTFAQTVINNHRAKVVLSGVSDTPTLDYISRLLGEEVRTETSQVRDEGGSIRSTTDAIRRQPLASPAELRQSETGSGVLVYGNLPSAKLRLRSGKSRHMRSGRSCGFLSLRRS